tara:strand:- start:10542 stop:10763 length:222 start_codon:yes stop_codon:yes gene_type:complete
MLVRDLLEQLQSLVDNDSKILDLPIRVIEGNDYEKNGIDAKPNYWLDNDSIEVNNTGQSGYEISGEVRLIGSE